VLKPEARNLHRNSLVERHDDVVTGNGLSHRRLSCGSRVARDGFVDVEVEVVRSCSITAHGSPTSLVIATTATLRRRQQDLAVLERSADNIADDVNETSRAAWEGVLEGLSECTQ
jgi:hypothetical protein